MFQKQRIAVIGAGVIGLNIAWRLAEAGAAVTLVESKIPGSGTTSTSFAWLNASSKVNYSLAYFELNAEAVRDHAALAVRAGAGFWGRKTGDIEIAVDGTAVAALGEKVGRLRAMDYAAEWLGPAGLAEREPGTVLPPGAAAAFYAEEGWADTGLFVAALQGFARASGVSLVLHDPALTVLQHGGRASGLRLASGREIAADVVVTALGRWTPGFAEALGIHVPLVPPECHGSKAVGLLARVVPAGKAPQRLLHSPSVNWSPLAEGRALLASDAGDRTVATDPAPEAAAAATRRLMEEATRLNPLFAGARLEHAGIGIRALPSDLNTICGWAEGLPGLYIAVTHSGVTLSPLLGRLVTREVLRGETVSILQHFRPNRFCSVA
ncbi:MAG TPA: FAD-binding oxidoreductase [Acidisoma sp.]|uniref:NAD(P)/FAD-dependent oxidoreductase n=1 Tax=Acidisoma sp. TaxID=1872115 RepID=UPI002CE20E8C|nr:FAD-binding oxidoreductase [Acidisoma sp.]HTH99513.1 FAD-binding oxidoreductase [Acidisoma sp.]